jgi:hypothetical protein
MAIVGHAGSVTSYDLAVGVKISIDELIYMISPIDSPLINGINTDGRQILASSPVDQTTYKWMDEELLLPRAQISVANTATGTSHTSVSVSAADSYKFQVGDLLSIAHDNRASGATSDTVLIVTNANHGAVGMTVAEWNDHAGALATVVGDTVICLGTALVEGSDPGTARTADRTIRSNNTQIFGPTPILMTRTEQQISRYGVSDEFGKQVYGRSVENVITREQAYLYGRQKDDTTNKKRSTGGIASFITSNVTNLDDSDNTLTITDVDSMLQKCYNAGGIPDLLIANPAAFATLNALTDSNRVRTVLDDPRRGRVPVTSILTEYGEVTCVRNRWCHAEDAFLVKRENISRRVIQPLIVEPLAKTGDSDKVQILCEEGLQVKGQQHMGLFHTATAYTDVPA